jgi:hypothetical protein
MDLFAADRLNGWTAFSHHYSTDKPDRVPFSIPQVFVVPMSRQDIADGAGGRDFRATGVKWLVHGGKLTC